MSCTWTVSHATSSAYKYEAKMLIGYLHTHFLFIAQNARA
jgi:hypothetical protein